MTLGPVEYIVVGFPGNKFTGEIVPELMELVRSGTVRVLDLIFIGKDEDGSVLAFEIDELDGVDAFNELEGEFGGLIGPADIEFVASKLEPGNCRTAALGGSVGGPLRRSTGEFGRRAPRRGSHSARTDRTRVHCAAAGSLSQRQRSQPMMMRRRPIARMAVRTTAVVGTAAVVGGHMANKQAQAQAAQAPEAAPAPVEAAPAPAEAGPDPVAQLTQLAALKDSGALTEAEFEAEKAKILG